MTLAALIAFLTKPIGRYAAIAALIVVGAAWFYFNGRADQKSADENRGMADVIDAAKEAAAARAGARAGEHDHPGGLPADPFRRD